jgi:uncharacterized protein (DUF58 family)
MSITDHLTSLNDAARRAVGEARSVGAPVWERVAPVLGVVTRLGWTVLGFSIAAWLVGWQFGWTELMVLATGTLALFAVSALLTIGRTRIVVEVTAEPKRVTMGQPAAGDVRIRNLARTPLLPIVLELPIADDAVRYQLPLLPAGGTYEELFVVPTQRRGVYPVGPATTVRGDPFGMLRRTMTWTEPIEVFVHPLTVPLEPLGAGLLRDLEGTTTNDLSMSDLAFHALREYQPGDDRRYIHWRSSAKASAREPGKFLVRQFLDTRRSHVCLLVDSHANSYFDPEQFETAIAAAASVAVRAIREDQQVTALAGAHLAGAEADIRILDMFSRAELSGHELNDLARRAIHAAPDVSIALMITGPTTPYAHFRGAARHFPIEVRTVGLRIDPRQQTGLGGDPQLPILTLQKLRDLGPLLSGGLS